MGEIVSKIKSLDTPQTHFRKIPQELLTEAMDKISLVDLVSETVSLAQTSQNQWKGLCPLHNEKTPSFFVNEEKGFYHCFGCQESGNAISFLMKVQGMPFKQAAARVLHLAGLDYADLVSQIQDNVDYSLKMSLKKMNDEMEEIGNETDEESIYETLLWIADACYDKAKENPELFDKIENVYLMVDDNFRFKNYERVEDIKKNFQDILKNLNDT